MNSLLFSTFVLMCLTSVHVLGSPRSNSPADWSGNKDTEQAKASLDTVSRENVLVKRRPGWGKRSGKKHVGYLNI